MNFRFKLNFAHDVQISLRVLDCLFVVDEDKYMKLEGNIH